ncbi:MAG: glycosyltransferase involved in cell wall biosynthesis [Limimaricola cinnabarinus]|jgi:glycosyltransferase involved in cell wall biosynthesis|uniref:glycosyltransferase n=1 Tax=Limimaricola cinnabarinus TaxID=1125964 RepID=UPI0039E445CD
MSDRSAAQGWRFPDRLAYVVSHALPHSSNGYAVRTHEVARALIARGRDVLVLTRPGRPWDIEGFPRQEKTHVEHRIDGVRYLNLPSPALPQTPRRARLRMAEMALFKAISVFRPAAVMAASDWENGEPAVNVARRLEIPFFYEQRGFWELSRAAQEPGWAEDPEFARCVEAETRLARQAETVFTLTGEMRDELVRRGVPTGRVRLVPNGMSLPRAGLRGPSRGELGVTARHLLAYIGSLNAYEGVEDLPRLLALLRGRGVDAALMVVGSSVPKGLVGGTGDPAHDRLRAAARTAGVLDHLHLVPQLPLGAVDGYYRLADAVVLPRRRGAATEMVAPLKPYAAAAHGKPVFMTDMPPLDAVAREIGGHLFPEGDMEWLAELLEGRLGAEAVPAAPVSEMLHWSERVSPMVERFEAVAADARLRLSRIAGDARLSSSMPEGPGFDQRALPQVMFGRQRAVAGIGPCRDLAAKQGFKKLTRQNLLGHMAAAEPGLFVIDWAGLEAEGEAGGEWDGLWSIANMRLNRQMLDAVRLARERGWRIEILGPIDRSRAPLYRSVAGLVDAEIDPVAGEVPDVPLPGETPSDTDTLADARKEVAS